MQIPQVMPLTQVPQAIQEFILVGGISDKSLFEFNSAIIISSSWISMRADLLLKLLSKKWLAFFFKWQDEDDNKEDWAIFKNHHPDKSHNMTRMGFIIFAPAHDLNDRTVWQTVNMFCVSYSRIGYNRYYIHHKIKNGTWIYKWDFELHKSPQTSPSQVRYGFINDLETVLWWNVLFSNALIMSSILYFFFGAKFSETCIIPKDTKKVTHLLLVTI